MSNWKGKVLDNKEFRNFASSIKVNNMFVEVAK